jgi:hypothetical protein
MPPVAFEPTTTVFEREKTVVALGRAATVIGLIKNYLMKKKCYLPMKTKLGTHGNENRVREDVEIEFCTRSSTFMSVPVGRPSAQHAES